MAKLHKLTSMHVKNAKPGDKLSDGGIIFVAAYGNKSRPNWERYRTVLSDAGLIIIDLLNGTCAAIKPPRASAMS